LFFSFCESAFFQGNDEAVPLNQRNGTAQGDDDNGTSHNKTETAQVDDDE